MTADAAAKPSAAVMARASVQGRYHNLIQVVNCAADPQHNLDRFGIFRDGGYWHGGAWCGQQGKSGYWVWVSPNWYVWSKEHDQAQSWASKPPDAVAEAIEHQGGTFNPLLFVVHDSSMLTLVHHNSGGGWLALVCAGGDCALEPATLKVRRTSIETSYHGTVPAQKLSFRFVRSGVRGRVLAWFRESDAAPWLKPGPIVSYRPRVVSQTIADGDRIRVQLPGGRHALLVPVDNNVGNGESKSPGIPSEPLQLQLGGKRQWLNPGFGMCAPNADYLIWSGDLDGDGKPDFLLNFRDEVGVVLLLSSQAEPGDMVGIGGYEDGGLAPIWEGECD
jgi:hypothetical protein